MTHLLKTTLLTVGLLAGIGGAAQASLPAGTAGLTAISATDSATPPVHEARRGRGADDPAGHNRRGRGKDDAPNHG